MRTYSISLILQKNINNIISVLFKIAVKVLHTSCSAGSPSFLHKTILHTLGSTQPIQHTIVPPRAYYSTSVVLHEAAMYDTGNRSNMRRFCTCFDTACDDSAQPRIHHKPIPHVPDSTQPVSTHQFFSTKLVLHHRSPFLYTNISQVGNVGKRNGLPTRFP